MRWDRRSFPGMIWERRTFGGLRQDGTPFGAGPAGVLGADRRGAAPESGSEPEQRDAGSGGNAFRRHAKWRTADAPCGVLPERYLGFRSQVMGWLGPLVLPVVVVVLTAVALPGQSGKTIALSTGLVALLTGVWLAFLVADWPNAVDAVLLLAVVGVGVGLQVLTDAGQAYATGYGMLFVAPFWLQLRAGLVPALAGWMALVAESAYNSGDPSVLAAVGNGIGALAFGAGAVFWGRVMRTSHRNAELVDELRESQEAEAKSAVLAERARLSRELHDVLAHTLAGLSLHLESTRLLVERRDVDPDVRAGLEKASALARTGLDEARRAVGALREGELPGPERLGEVVAEFERRTGTPATLSVYGEPRPLSSEARAALYRAMQESLTNVTKHAHADRVEVVLDWAGGGEVALRVRDVAEPPPCSREPALAVAGAAAGSSPSARMAWDEDAAGPPGKPPLTSPAVAASGGGHGLLGMRERALLAGGSLDAGSTGDGFAVELRLPA
jgi:signal transduction histidine kinase